MRKGLAAAAAALTLLPIAATAAPVTWNFSGTTSPGCQLQIFSPPGIPCGGGYSGYLTFDPTNPSAVISDEFSTRATYAVNGTGMVLTYDGHTGIFNSIEITRSTFPADGGLADTVFISAESSWGRVVMDFARVGTPAPAYPPIPTEPLDLSLYNTDVLDFAYGWAFSYAAADGASVRLIGVSEPSLFQWSLADRARYVLEPGTLGLFAAGLLAIGLARRRVC